MILFVRPRAIVSVLKNVIKPNFSQTENIPRDSRYTLINIFGIHTAAVDR